ncbi:MAG: hypoxanthine phosphoribosyltransferase [Clostridia bacterium]|nr:hypoxanthine phosphoribosyltransferase [Clostridia bacterium]
MELHPDCERMLLTEEQIQEGVKSIGEALAKRYEGKNPLFICILKGSVVFFSDIIRATQIPLTIDFMKVSSYGSSTTSSELHIAQDLKADVAGKDVVIIEDIIDSGRTIYYLKHYLTKQGAKSVCTVTLLDKPSRRKFDLTTDYSAFIIEDEFVVGYGLDYAENYRNLPYVGILKRSVYEK